LCLSAGNKKNKVEIKDGLVRPKSALSGCTGLSGGGAPGWLRRTSCSREMINDVQLKFTGLSGVHRTVRCAPDCPVSQRSVGPTVGRAIRARHVAEPTVGRGHRTVRWRTGLSGALGDRRQEMPSWNALNGS
jgi:hypothetical protein